MERSCGVARAALALLTLLALQHTAAKRCSQVVLPDSGPNFTMSLDAGARTLTVSVATAWNVRARLCYQQHRETCSELLPPVVHLITPQSPNATLRLPDLQPCLCVQVYFHLCDAVRTTACPFEHHLDNVWRSSHTNILGRNLLWSSQCPLQPLATLCWRLLEVSPDCLHIANSTLQVDAHTRTTVTKYDISHVDKHPDMCVKLVLNGTSHRICPFSQGHLEWHAEVVPTSWHIRVLLTSSIPASFSAQLCTIQGEECVSWGTVHSIRQVAGANRAELLLPVLHVQPRLCVQVWRSDPPLDGRRFFCLNCSHRRWGLVAMAAFVVLICGVCLVYLSYRMALGSLTDWRGEHKPVLLVCSSDDMQLKSAMCALASILQTELCAGVRLALLAQRGDGGVADLGPLPWLYGQCETVQGAGGCVLLIWSPEGKQAYQNWSAGTAPPEATEPSAVTVPVLRAALVYLQAALRGHNPHHGFALVCFQGLCQQQDIPPELHALPVFRLPRDFNSLLQVLHEPPPDTRRRCWHSLHAAVQAHMVAKRMAQKLRPWLPAKDPERVGWWARLVALGMWSPTWMRVAVCPQGGQPERLRPAEVTPSWVPRATGTRWKHTNTHTQS